MRLPPDHPLRAELNNEVHARPPEVLEGPVRVSYLALVLTEAEREEEAARLVELAARMGAPPPARGANHFSSDLGSFRLRWERHTEFSRYMFIVGGVGSQPFAETAVDSVPEMFTSRLPGKVIAAIHAEVLDGADESFDLAERSRRCFGGNVLIGSQIGETRTSAQTDFRIHPDGFSRFLIVGRDLSGPEAGRLVQRLLEIDTYKTLALLAFPLSRSLAPFLNRSERELASITTSLAEGRSSEEADLLGRLTQLEAEIESRGAENHFRFSAAAAYYEIVQRRIAELRETRLPGLQTFGEFIERRLAPAMNTCTAASARQEALSSRVARATQLLSTRIAVTRTQQSQDVLRSMNRRAHLQLRLQETVEGLSVAAITYYIVGLVNYAAKGLKPLGLDLNPDVVMAASIPVVLLVAALYIRRLRQNALRTEHLED